MKERKITFVDTNGNNIMGIVYDKFCGLFADFPIDYYPIDYYLVKEILEDGSQRIHRILPSQIIKIE